MQPTRFQFAETDDREDSRAPEHSRKKSEIIAEGFKNKTKGEAVFNIFSYFGMGYGLVTAMSVLNSWLMRDSKWFSSYFEKFATGVTKKFGWSSEAISIATLFIGGTIASVFPVKWLEERKSEFVKKLDRVLYTDEEFNGPKVQTAHKELDELPKQTWLSVGFSRVVAFAMTYGLYGLAGSNKSWFATKFGQSISKYSAQFGRRADRFFNHHDPAAISAIDQAIATNKARMNLPKSDDRFLKDLEIVRDPIGGDRTTTKVWSYIGLDLIYTAVTAVALFVSTRIFGGLFGKDPNIKPNTHPRSSSPELQDSLATPTPSSVAPTAAAPTLDARSVTHEGQATARTQAQEHAVS